MNIPSKAKSLVLWLVLFAGLTAPAEDSFFDRELDGEVVLLRNAFDKPEAFLRLYAVWDLADFARWDGRIPNVLDEILISPKSSPLLKSYALWFSREADLRRGDFEEAQRKQQRLGFVTDWLIIGPFDNEGMAGFDLAYPPEEEIKLTEIYNGKERPVAWREYPFVRSAVGDSPAGVSQQASGSFDCFIDLAATLRPNSRTAAYALACVFSTEPQHVAIRLASDDCAKVWLADKLVLPDPDCHLIGFDQAVAPALLWKGWNKLLVKVCQDEGAWGFRLRLTSPDGAPASSLRYAAGSDEVAKALSELVQAKNESLTVEPANAASSAADPVAEFRNLVVVNPDNAEHHANLSFLLWHTGAFDKNRRDDIREMEAAVSLAPREWRYHFWLGEMHDDENKKRAAYEKVMELNPDYAPAYSRLGRHFSRRGLEGQSVRFYRQAIEKDPSYYPAILGLAEHLSGSSQKARAAQLFRDLLTACPDTPHLLRYAVEFAPFPTKPQDSQKRCEAALRLNFCDRDVRNSVLSNCYDRHDPEGAIRQLNVIEQISPMAASIFLDHARLLGNQARCDDAGKLIDHALRICPEDDAALTEKGELVLRQDRRDEALEWFEKSLTTKPQNRPLREYIEFLKPREKPFEEDYKVDATTVVTDASSEPRKEGDSALYLFDLWVREVHPNGLSNSYHQEIVKVLSEAGVEAFRFRSAVYRPTTDEIQVKAARVFKKDGRVINADGPFSHTFGGEERIYYDLEAKYVRFSNLEPGDTIEFSYRANAITPSNMYGDYFGDVVYFKDTVPKKVMRYVVLMPPGKELYYKVVGMDVQPAIEARSNATAYVWKVENVEKVESESFMPGYSEILPYVHVSTYKDWDGVGEWYWNLIRDQFLLDSSAKAEIARITAALKTEQEKIAAIYNSVVQSTRYIGLEFGIHGHKPYPAYKVYWRRFGDCKDKAGLMIAMLKEIGVEGCMAVVRTKSRGQIDPHPASLAAFNHVICYVPKYDMWLDGTAEYSGVSELPYEDQGTCALVVGKSIRNLVTTSVLGSERNVTSDRYDAKILSDGGIEFELTRETIGQHAPYFRRMHQEEKHRENVLARTWGTVLPNIRITEVHFDNLKDLEKPLRYGFKAFVPNYAVTDQSGSVAFAGLISKLQLTRRYAALSKRKYDLVLDFPWRLDASIKFRLPSGYRVVSLPDDLHLQTDFGKCDTEFDFTQPSSVTVGFRFSFDVARVTTDQYDAFREFCRLIDEKQEEKIRIAK